MQFGSFGNKLVTDRRVEPRRFRLFLLVCAATVPLLIVAALFPSISN